MKHIIIGGDGFVGRHLADRLSRLGEQVVVGDIVKSDLPVYRTVPCATFDVTRPETFRAVDLQPDDVYLASLPFFHVNTQSWAMFAPNPHRSNVFMKVMVKDEAGEIWDLKHDIYGKREYPYLWYDRMGKINRRLIDQ